MRILGVDYGEKRIGLAISDSSQTVARSLKILKAGAKAKDIFGEIKTIVKENEVEMVVVGLPKNMNGSLGEKGKEVLEFVDALKDVLNVPVTTWDERLSTVSAEKILREADVSRDKRKEILDKLSACIILQNYLDSIKKEHR